MGSRWGGNHSSTNSGSGSIRKQNNDIRRRSTNAIGLESFAQRKGQIRALQEFKKRKNEKTLGTSIALRKYRKLMKQEGHDAGSGASRKRLHEVQGGTLQGSGIE